MAVVKKVVTKGKVPVTAATAPSPLAMSTKSLLIAGGILIAGAAVIFGLSRSK